MQGAEIGDVLARRQLRVDAGGMRQDTNGAPRCKRIANDVDAVHARAAGIRPEHGIEDTQRRGLAGAIRPEQAGDAPIARLEADTVDRADRAEAAAQPSTRIKAPSR